MKSKFWILTLTIILSISSTTHANVEQEKEGMLDPSMEAMMANFAAYGTPGENHKALNTLIGYWNSKVQHWMAPNTDPEISEGTSEAKWIMDGRFVQQKFIGKAMGSPFEGLGIIGFDNLTKKYNSIWLDNMGTGIMKSTGSFDSASNTMTESGNFSCPMTGGPRKYRSVTTVINNDHYTYETFMNDENGNEFRAVLITYQRQGIDDIVGNFDQK